MDLAALWQVGRFLFISVRAPRSRNGRPAHGLGLRSSWNDPNETGGAESAEKMGYAGQSAVSRAPRFIAFRIVAREVLGLLAATYAERCKHRGRIRDGPRYCAEQSGNSTGPAEF